MTAHLGSDASLTVIEPTRGWKLLRELRDVWAYRELLWMLVIRDVKVRYKQTVLGVGWAVIQPVLIMLVFSIFFGRLAKMPSDGFPYPIFAYAGLLPWIYFANSVTSAAESVVGSANLVTKIYFPRLIIPLASAGAGLIDFLVAVSVLILLMFYYGVEISINLLGAPLLLVGVLFTALGVGTLLAALNVAYRDVRYTIPFLIQLWLFATPVVYPIDIVPEEWRWLLFLNPMAGIVDGFRSAVLGKAFAFDGLAISIVVSIAFFIAGTAYFKQVERRFADIV